MFLRLINGFDELEIRQQKGFGEQDSLEFNGIVLAKAVERLFHSQSIPE